MVHTVKVGQVWMDCDKRMYNRKLLVVRIEGDHALCANAADRNGKARTKIRLDRFRKSSTGFILVHDAPP
jgi:hypothetical protein